MSHFESLLPQAAEVRDATLEGENTALRVGSLFVNLLQALAAALPAMAIDASSIKQSMVGGAFTISYDVVSDSGVTASQVITIPAVSETSAGLITPELLGSITSQLSSIAGVAGNAASDAASAVELVSSLASIVADLDSFSEHLRSNVDYLSDTANSFDERLEQLEALNLVPLAYLGAYRKMDSPADLIACIKPDKPGLQLIKSLTGKIDFLVMVTEDGNPVINPLPFCKKEGFGTAEFNAIYLYRYAHTILKVVDKSRITVAYLPTSDTEGSIATLAERMNRLEEISGGTGSVEFEGSTLAAINEALSKANAAHSRSLEALESAHEAQEAVASVSLMAERVAPFLRYHAMPVTAVRPDGCFDSDGPGIYLVPANDKYEYSANFEFGDINGRSGTPWDAWESPEKAQAWEEHWEAVKAALQLPYDIQLMDFGTVDDADDVMDANDGLYFCIEEQRYYRVTANGSILEPMLFPSDIEEFTDEAIESAAQKALNSANNK